jgi:hypothetical protein
VNLHLELMYVRVNPQPCARMDSNAVQLAQEAVEILLASLAERAGGAGMCVPSRTFGHDMDRYEPFPLHGSEQKVALRSRLGTALSSVSQGPEEG